MRTYYDPEEILAENDRQKAEIARLREALERIWNPINWDARYAGNWWGESHPREIAFSALDAAKKEARK